MQTSEYYEEIYLLESTCGINFIIPELRKSFLKIRTYVIVTTSASWDQLNAMSTQKPTVEKYLRMKMSLNKKVPTLNILVSYKKGIIGVWPSF